MFLNGGMGFSFYLEMDFTATVHRYTFQKPTPLDGLKNSDSSVFSLSTVVTALLVVPLPQTEKSHPMIRIVPSLDTQAA